MKISVVVPAYNCEDTLRQTISSILNCGIEDLEILIIDDGSEDDTPAICNHLSNGSKIIRSLHQTNKGVSTARNSGIQESTGDYLWFFDSDDLVDPGSMKHAVMIVDEREPDMLIFGMTFDYFNKGKMYQRLILQYEREEEMGAY